jgi:hypothetical protein
MAEPYGLTPMHGNTGRTIFSFVLVIKNPSVHQVGRRAVHQGLNFHTSHLARLSLDTLCTARVQPTTPCVLKSLSTPILSGPARVLTS